MEVQKPFNNKATTCLFYALISCYTAYIILNNEPATAWRFCFYWETYNALNSYRYLWPFYTAHQTALP